MTEKLQQVRLACMPLASLPALQSPCTLAMDVFRTRWLQSEAAMATATAVPCLTQHPFAFPKRSKKATDTLSSGAKPLFP
ncbi:MAG: hypothetical protein KAY08_01495 [Giesbergeria sp.]|nr:hypothetical protein [Giesbergeria sp.]MBP8091488.1 hypothetical protein [Giesbergeria sp.]